MTSIAQEYIGDTWTVVATVSSTSVTSLNVSGGQNYTQATATIGPPQPGGTPAIMSANVSNGQVQLELESGGLGYDPNNPPPIVITGNGTGAGATAIIGPQNLTGYTAEGQLFVAGIPTPLPLTPAINAAVGQVTFTIQPSTTATIPANPQEGPRRGLPGRYNYPTRLQGWVIDANGNKTTVVLVGFDVQDPQTVPLC